MSETSKPSDSNIVELERAARAAKLDAGQKRAADAAKEDAAKKAAAAGFKGKKNIYVCRKCFGHIVTVDVDEGVTPFALACRATVDCDGWMQSSMYRVFDQSMKAGFEWYRPSVVEVVPLAAQHHVSRGGLLIRKAS